MRVGFTGWKGSSTLASAGGAQLGRQTFLGLPASSQFTTQRLIINYKSSAYSLGLFLTLSYNLNEPIYINLRSVMWSFISRFLSGSPLCLESSSFLSPEISAISLA